MLPAPMARGYEWMGRAVACLAATILIALTAAVFVGVFVRYLGLFQGSLSWLVELSVTPIASAARSRTHWKNSCTFSSFSRRGIRE